jgi:pre-mRNA-splicing helicase BRR2
MCQKHTKIKDVTWWVLIGDHQNNLLATKKVSVKKKVELKLQIDVPDNLERNYVSVYLMADSYVGLDQI